MFGSGLMTQALAMAGSPLFEAHLNNSIGQAEMTAAVTSPSVPNLATGGVMGLPE